MGEGGERKVWVPELKKETDELDVNLVDAVKTTTLHNR